MVNTSDSSSETSRSGSSSTNQPHGRVRVFARRTAGRQTLKAKHLARNPNVSLFYWTAEHNTVFAQCRAEWADDAAT